MKTILEEFGNEKCVILKLLYDNQIKVKDDCYVSLSQQEMADKVHYSKVKTNKIINDLKRKELDIETLSIEFVKLIKDSEEYKNSKNIMNFKLFQIFSKKIFRIPHFGDLTLQKHLIARYLCSRNS